MNILLVEDDLGVKEFIAAMLHRSGHTVETGSDGDEALRIYRNRKCDYDLVLTDRDHPGMDGIELAATIRKMNPSQPVAFQTAGSGDSIVEERMARCGVNDLPRIEKPFSLEQLLRFVESVTENFLPKNDNENQSPTR